MTVTITPQQVLERTQPERDALDVTIRMVGIDPADVALIEIHDDGRSTISVLTRDDSGAMVRDGDELQVRAHSGPDGFAYPEWVWSLA